VFRKHWLTFVQILALVLLLQSTVDIKAQSARSISSILEGFGQVQQRALDAMNATQNRQGEILFTCFRELGSKATEYHERAYYIGLLVTLRYPLILTPDQNRFFEILKDIISFQLSTLQRDRTYMIQYSVICRDPTYAVQISGFMNLLNDYELTLKNVR
jgi:hypothetical protein